MNNLGGKLFRVAVFYAIAVAFAYVFRIAEPEWYDDFHLPAGLWTVKYLFAALGPILGAFLVTRLFSVERRTTTLGTRRFKSVGMALVPVILFTIFGASSGEGLNEYYFGLVLGILMVVYCFFEEAGWRGYLQDELRGLPQAVRFPLVGLLWYAWHLSFLGNTNLGHEFQILVILIGASWGIGLAVEHTRSVMVAACLHIIGNIVALSSLLKQSFTGTERLIIAGICVAVWIPILIYWEKNRPTSPR